MSKVFYSLKRKGKQFKVKPQPDQFQELEYLSYLMNQAK